MSRLLPPSFRSALDRMRDGAEARVLADRAAGISEAYRRNDPSSRAIRAREDAVAYALTRAPATFAAVGSVLERLAGGLPEFAPGSCLDLGAGPGTASFAAVDVFDDLDSLTLIDHNPVFVDLARDLAGAAEHPALVSADIRQGDLERDTLPERTFDLALVSYALTELADAAASRLLVEVLVRTTGALVIVEPGTPRDYARLMQFRGDLLAIGGQILAPCPMNGPCPLTESDWCHFSVRLARTREHKQLKGANLPFEDEKFSYLIVLPAGVDMPRPRPSRVIRPLHVTKPEVSLSLCTPDGLETRRVPARDKARFKALSKLDWGDALDDG